MIDSIKAVLIVLSFFVVLGVFMHLDPMKPMPKPIDVPVSLGMQYPMCAMAYGSEDVDLYCMTVEYGVQP